MSNSFFYFFSAVPQVLGGVLALFGVFVIFKLQTLRQQLTNVVQELYDDCKSSETVIRPINRPFYNHLEKALKNEDREELDKLLNMESKTPMETAQKKYSYLTNLRQSLIKGTILLSISTAIVIIICLIAIPFGCVVLKHPILLRLLFAFVIVGITICFTGLLIILTRSINDDYKPIE